MGGAGATVWVLGQRGDGGGDFGGGCGDSGRDWSALGAGEVRKVGTAEMEEEAGGVVAGLEVELERVEEKKERRED